MADERCPQCGGPVKWFHLDVSNGPYPEQIRSRYECVLGGQCPGIQAKIEQGLPLSEPCPRCGGTAVRMMIEVPKLHQPKPWPMVPGELVCMRSERDCSDVQACQEMLPRIEAVVHRPWPVRLWNWLTETAHGG